ncbi:MAG: flagellar export protein FliJ [Thermoguttaceae bacterium]|jgi:flagellar FliJ protein
MNTFRFRLSPVLQVREAARQERRSRLGEAYRADELLQRRLQAVESELDQLRGVSRRAARPGPVDVDRLVESQRYALGLRSQQAQILRQREDLAAEIQRRRQALLEADREVRVLEKLRQRQAERHRVEEDRREAKRLDEIAQQKIMREVAP